MAISSPTLVQNFYDTDNASSYPGNDATNSSGAATLVLTAGRRYFVSVHSYRSGGNQQASSVVHDAGGTPTNFSKCNDGTNDAYRGSGSYGVGIWHANITSTTANAAITVTFPASQSACGFLVWWIDGEDDTGTIVQVVTNSGSGTQSSVTMGSYAATDNMALLTTAVQTTGRAIGVEESRVEIGESDETERADHADHYTNPHASDTSLTASISGASVAWLAIGIEIKATAAAGPVEVTPGLGQLTLTGFAPAVVIGTVIATGLGQLDLTGFAPSAVIGIHAYPALGQLTLTGFAPTVTASNNITVTPALGQLDLTGFAPTVSVSDNKTVTPALGELTLTGFAPSVVLGIHAYPALGELTLTGFAPLAQIGITVTTGLGQLDLTGFAPTVTTTAHVTVTPGLGELTLTGFAPVVTGGEGLTVTPGTGQLALTGFAPTVTATTNTFVYPGFGQLTLTGFAPSVVLGTVVTPGLGQLTLTGFAPTASIGVYVSPALGQLTLTGFAPTVTATLHVTASPGLGQLILTGFAPTVQAGIEGLAEPGTGELVLVGFAPLVTVADIPQDFPPGRPRIVTLWAWETRGQGPKLMRRP